MFRRTTAVGILSVFVVFVTVISLTDGGSPCPPRAKIYPCICTEVRKSRQSTYTIVTCSHIPSSTVLSTNAIHIFKEILIDRMIIVDSFLEAAQNYGREADLHRNLPQNWLTQMRIRELEVVDSQLSPCFACDFSERRSNSFQTHVSIVNSTRSDKVCTLCQVGNETQFSWIGCMTHLRYFNFRQNGLKSVEYDFFPVIMDNLLEVNMSYNMISRLGTEAFRNLPKLVKLDLSHNNIRDVRGSIFGRNQMNLKHLDLSWNQIITIPSDILRFTPKLLSLHLQNNFIDRLEERRWRYMSSTLRTLNLSGNRIQCDCCLTWLNASLNTWTVVHGYCASPTTYNATPLRRASGLLIRQCADSRNACD